MSKRGFTLIELLIVITIIGVLSVVFIPSAFNAPAKARDVARKASIGNIVKSVEAARASESVLFGVGGITTGCVNIRLSSYSEYFPNGTIPSDPLSTNTVVSCVGQFFIRVYTSGWNYKYGVFAKVEKKENANLLCGSAAAQPVTLSSSVNCDVSLGTCCYGILSK